MRAAISFLTPFGGACDPSPSALSWFPLVGALQGLVLGLVWWAANDLFTALVAAVFVVIADLAITGMLHLDGLADSADGLLAPLDRSRRLEVMATPTVGAFGIAVVVSVLLLRVAATAALEPSPFLLSSLWCASRTVMAGAAQLIPYVRKAGLASAFINEGEGARRGWLTVSMGAAMSLILALVAAVFNDGPVGDQEEITMFIAVTSVGLGALAVLQLARHRIGGFTGDVLGAAALVGETVGLVVATARW